MSFIIVGLGNPGKEYENTRHNAGRLVLETTRVVFGGSDFTFDKKLNALVSEAKIKKEKLTLITPETFMNNSGKSVGQLIKSVKVAEKTIVIYDDFQLPLGRIKISYNRSSGGHKGLESIIKAIKTEKFTRIRVGTASENSKGNAKVPHGDKVIEKFILSDFKSNELKILKKVAKTAIKAIEMIVVEGKDRAMSVFNH